MESCKKNMEGYDRKMFLRCYNYYNIKHCAYDASHKPVFFHVNREQRSIRESCTWIERCFYRPAITRHKDTVACLRYFLSETTAGTSLGNSGGILLFTNSYRATCGLMKNVFGERDYRKPRALFETGPGVFL